MPLQMIDYPPLSNWQQVVVILGLAVALAFVIRVALGIWIRQSTKATETDIDRVVYEEVIRPLYLTTLLAGVYLVLPILKMPQVEFVGGAFLISVIVILWARAGIKLVSRLITVIREQGREPEFAPVLKNLWTFFVVVGSFFIFLEVWGLDVTPLLAGAGVAGIIIGIAAQDSIGNFFAGISLNLDQTYQVGDILQLEDGTRGTVTNISVRSTTILTRDNIEVTVPNSYLNNTQVINESSPRRRRRIRTDVGVAYGSNLEDVRSTLIDVALGTNIILDDPTPEVRFRQFGDSAINAQLVCFISHPAQLGQARHQLIMGIAEAFAETDIKIPFPQRELSFFESENSIHVRHDEPRGDDTHVE